MLSYRKATIIDIEEEDENISWIKIGQKNGGSSRAINYNCLTGIARVGDIVIINTTAVDLSLGTGGVHFVMFNYSNYSKKLEGKGHIMKLRYTPYQIRCFAAEEEGNQYHDLFKNFESLENHIVIIGSIHSMLAPIIAMIKWLNYRIKINYLMTDGGSLPIFFSETVRELKARGLVGNTITVGHAFGGDLECTNIYNGLIAAKKILNGDVTVVTMGPGIVGTGTKYGFSSIEQGHNIDVVNTLGGDPVIVPRISFKDLRGRHYGLSHHTRTILADICKTGGTLILPILDRDKHKELEEQITATGLNKKHRIIYENGNSICKAMDSYKLKTTTMGRGYKDDAEYFKALGAVGQYIVKRLK